MSAALYDETFLVYLLLHILEGLLYQLLVGLFYVDARLGAHFEHRAVILLLILTYQSLGLR